MTNRDMERERERREWEQSELQDLEDLQAKHARIDERLEVLSCSAETQGSTCSHATAGNFRHAPLCTRCPSASNLGSEGVLLHSMHARLC